MYAVEVEKLTKIYGQGRTAVRAIEDATLRVKPGELVAILGPSGSGKTTLLTAIGLINEPTHGKVVIDGTIVADEGWLPGLDLKKIRREKLGFIFQAHNLIPFLTALENVLLPAEILGLPLAAAREPEPPAAPLPVAEPSPPVMASAPQVPVTSDAGGIYLQLGAFGSRENAENFLARMKLQVEWLASTLHVFSRDGLFRVHAGPYAREVEARQAADRISQSLGVRPFVLTR